MGPICAIPQQRSNLVKRASIETAHKLGLQETHGNIS